MLVCSFVRPYVRPSRNVRLCTANKRLDLDTPLFAYVCTLTRYCRLLIFIQIVNVFDFQFQSQRLESNALASSYVKSVVFVGTAETKRTDYTNRHNVKGCQEARRTIPLAKICQGVLGIMF